PLQPRSPVALLLQRSEELRRAVVCDLLQPGSLRARLGRERGLRLDVALGRRELLLQACCALPLLDQGFSQLWRASFLGLLEACGLVAGVTALRLVSVDRGMHHREVLSQRLGPVVLLLQRSLQ